MCLRYKRFGLFTLLIAILAIFSLQLESKVTAADNRYCPDNPRNLTRNPTMDGGHGTRFGTVANEWEPFIYEGDAPHFTLVDNEEQIREDKGGIVQYLDSNHKFDAGIYQTVSGLVPNVYYSFYVGQALAARDLGNGRNIRVDSIGRQIGVDVTGGVDPHSPSVIWGPQFWSGGPSLYIDDMGMTFAARADRVTLYVRAFNRDIQGVDKVWLDIVCLIPRDDLPTATPSAPTATLTPQATSTRASTNTPPATSTATDTPTPTTTSTPTVTPTWTPTATDAPRVRRVIPTIGPSELNASAVKLESSQVLGGIGVFAIGSAVVMLFSGGLVWFLRR
ncbi:MAG TPA: hypothetical protein VIX58_10060 [Anaerolineae bacterium]